MHWQRDHLWHWTAVAAAVVAASLMLVLGGELRAWLLIRNTFLLAGGAAAIALPVGLLLAFLLVRTDLRGRQALLLGWGVLLFVPLYLQASGWEAGFGRQGWWSLSHGSMAQPWLDGWRAAIWVHGLAAIPWVLLIVGLGLRLVEPELEEAALLEGSAAAVMWLVTARRALPFVGAAAMWVFVSTSTEMTVTDLYRVRTFAEEIYLDVPFAGAIDVLEPLRPTTATHVTLLACLVLSSLLIFLRLAPPEHLPSVRHRRAFRLGGAAPIAWVFTGIVLLVVVGVPLANLVYKAGLMVEQVGAERVRRWSLVSFARIISTSPVDFLEEHGWTLLIGSVTATAAVIVAAPLAWLARRGGVRAIPALSISAVCLALPGPMIGLTVIWLLNRDGIDLLIWLYDRTIFAPCLALLVRCLPVTLLVIWYAFRTVAEEFVEQAKTEGLGWLTRFWSLGVAQHWPVLAGAWLAALAVATGDLSASILVLPPGISTIPVRVFGLLHSGVDDQVAGISLTVVGSFVLLGWLLIVLLRRQDRDRPTVTGGLV